MALLGFIAGVAFVVACPDPRGASETTSGDTSTSSGTLGPGSATAATGGDGSPCEQWEVRIEQVQIQTEDAVTLSVSPGFEPFQVTYDNVDVVRVTSRRCTG
jgi:hypothetical protein